MHLSDEVILNVVQGVIDDILKPKFIELGMNASGTWLNSLEARVNGNTGEIWGMDYTYYLANGRGENEDQDDASIHWWAKWATATFIGQWVADKGIDKRLTFPIAYSIAKNGTKSYPNGTDLLEVLNSDEVSEYIKDRIGRFLIRSIQVDILKRTKEALV